MENILLNYYKLESLFNLGKLEETIVHANNEILPDLNKFITKNKTLKGLDISDLKNIETETKLILAKSYVYQGNKLALPLILSIIEKAQKENLPEIQIRAVLLQSLFLTIQGDMKTSNSIIAEIKNKFASAKSPEKLKLQWYFTAILSNLINGNFKQAKELCVTTIKIADYFKDYNLLNLTNLIMGKCLEEAGMQIEAFKIYDKVVSYCSENKMATGALFSWYLASDSDYRTGNYDKSLEVSERALEISQKPTISNTLVAILLNILIAGARTAKKDYERALINIEAAVTEAEKKQFVNSACGSTS